MADPFNPYTDWLEIPHEEQPPDHYRLLGLRTFERDEQRISDAADTRMKMLRAFQNGSHARESQQVLNEVAAAKVCLLDHRRRHEYEQELRRRRAALNLAPLPPAPELVPRNEMPMRAPDHIRKSLPRDPESWLQPVDSSVRHRERMQKWIIPTAIGLFAVVALVVALLWYSSSN